MSGYEVYALKYAQAPGRKSARYHRFETYAEADADAGLDFYFWLLRDDTKTILVDCGFDAERTKARGYAHDRHPLAILSEFGLSAGDVDHVVLSHMHFDHVGNVGLFPNATFSIARSEFAFWRGPLADRPHLNGAVEMAEVQTVAQLVAEDRVILVDDEMELAPGVLASVVGGHTPGQMITTVANAEASIVLASDASHLYEEYQLDRPYWLFSNLPEMYTAYARLRELEEQPGTVVIPGHDPQVMRRFEATGDIVDLTAPTGWTDEK